MKKKILLLLWHPDNAVAGGFIRLKEFLPYFDEYSVTVIDNSPSVIKDTLKNGEIITYTIPKIIKKAYALSFFIGRILEWSYAFISLLRLGTRELRTGDYKVIYGPTGDNLHIFLAGIFLRIFYSETKLLLDILNLELPEKTIDRYFNSLRASNISFLRSIFMVYGMVVLLQIEKMLIKKCDFVVTTSPYMRSVIKKYYPVLKIHVTPSGVRQINKTEKMKNIDGLYIGRVTAEKGIVDLIKSWEKICEVKEDAKLIIAGFADESFKGTVMQMVRESGLEQNVYLLGLISEEKKWKLLKRAKIFLHLAYFEPLVPVITVLEALACGLPTIIYDMPTVNDCPDLRRNKALIISQNRDTSSVAKEVLKLLKLNEKQRDKISFVAFDLSKQYDWSKIVKIELAVIKKLYK